MLCTSFKSREALQDTAGNSFRGEEDHLLLAQELLLQLPPSDKASIGPALHHLGFPDVLVNTCSYGSLAPARRAGVGRCFCCWPPPGQTGIRVILLSLHRHITIVAASLNDSLSLMPSAVFMQASLKTRTRTRYSKLQIGQQWVLTCAL